VRLDHLLSKEHWQCRPLSARGVLESDGDHRELQVDHWLFHPRSEGRLGSRKGTRAFRYGRWSTLFGPEGASPWGERGLCKELAFVVDLENFIASASIWAKLLRAHGGCLGAKSRRRTREAAKSPGEPPTRLRSGGIRMGKPGRGHARSSRSEYIGPGREPPELKHLSKARKRKQPRLP
jgi:hypothetical protein